MQYPITVDVGLLFIGSKNNEPDVKNLDVNNLGADKVGLKDDKLGLIDNNKKTDAETHGLDVESLNSNKFSLELCTLWLGEDN